MENTNKPDIVVILNNVRSNENVGSIFRTCDAVEVSKMFLVGITPAPTDRFNRINKGLVKASLGAEKFVEYEKVLNLKEAIQQLKEEGYKIIGVEQSKNSIDYKLLSKDYNLALVFGNEVGGLSKEDLEICDEVIEISMYGHKESLNVAVAVGVILFSIPHP